MVILCCGGLVYQCFKEPGIVHCHTEQLNNYLVPTFIVQVTRQRKIPGGYVANKKANWNIGSIVGPVFAISSEGSSETDGQDSEENLAKIISSRLSDIQ
jgi:hypothetical protein